MRVFVDCRYVRVDRHDGISRYTVGLVHALAARHPVEMLICDPRQRAHLPTGRCHLISAPASISEPFVARQVRRLGPDVVFSPMQTMGSWGRRYGLVLTVHDLIYYRHRTPPPQFPAPVRLLWRLYHLSWWPQRVLLNRADAVVTVSHTTAGLISRHRLTRRPVTVVPDAAEPPDPSNDAATATTDRPRPSRPPSLVYMGSFMPYKNVATLVRAMRELPEYELNLMSRIDDAEQARLAAMAPGSRLIFHRGATDTTYREVLCRATALLSASREEGFGIPLVEAMTVGTPVIVSDIPVFREVGGTAAAYCAPGDVDGFVNAIRELEEPGCGSSARTPPDGRRRPTAGTTRRSGCCTCSTGSPPFAAETGWRIGRPAVGSAHRSGMSSTLPTSSRPDSIDSWAATASDRGKR